mmetsp:Transcript_26824/g.45234  ORF Transcript_26824/g.45234 Transcript_26824/m.45234 type:complete len:628 (-) Transcript_26824:740-2623(-)
MKSAQFVNVRLMLTALATIVLFAFSLTPLLFGKLQPKQSIPINNGINDEDTSSKIMIEIAERINGRKSEIRALEASIESLGTIIRNYSPPVPSASKELVSMMEESDQRHSVIKQELLELMESVNKVRDSNNDLLAGLQKGQSERLRLQANIDNLIMDTSNIDAKINESRLQTQELRSIQLVTRALAARIKDMDEKMKLYSGTFSSQLSDFEHRVESWNCTEQHLSVSSYNGTEIHDMAATIVKRLVENERKTETGENCLDMSSAQSIVSAMVSRETRLLNETVSVQLNETATLCTAAAQEAIEAINATYGGCAYGNTSEISNQSSIGGAESGRGEDEEEEKVSLTSFLGDAMGLLRFDQSTAGTGTAAGTTRGSKTDDRYPDDLDHASGVPALDYALLSAGSAVLVSRTSATYFPTQWQRHDGLLGDAMGLLGFDPRTPVGTSSSGASKSVPVTGNRNGEEEDGGGSRSRSGGGSAGSLVEMLNLQKAVGVPEEALTVDTHLGACWPMQGSAGNLSVILMGHVFIESISIDHVSSKNAKNLHTAPKEFEVYGLNLETGEEWLLTRGAYTIGGGSPAVQNFAVVDKTKSSIRSELAFQAVTLRILSNHGHGEYTCLYRFRVHGSAAPS